MVQVDYAALKNEGFLQQKQQDVFSLRLRTAGGQMPAEHLTAVYKISQKYGQGYVHFTSRQSVEIPHIQLADIAAVKQAVLSAGMTTCACGATVRTITACQGNAVCSHGHLDTSALAKALDARYHGHPLTHKFKIGITGCCNNCLKAEENDLGIKGGVKPSWHQDSCNYCGACAARCPAHAIAVDKQAQSLRYDEAKCIFCGKCVKACHAKAWSGQAGMLLFFGGLFGNQIAIGRRLLPMVFSESELHTIIAFTLSFFKQHGKPKERFCTTVRRLGWKRFYRELEAVVSHTSAD